MAEKSLPDKIDSAMGALVGAAVGDALGAPLEFLTPRDKEDWETEMRGGGVLKWQPGDITDDTTMNISVCEMYLENSGYDQRALVEKWLKWKRTGPKDIGNWTAAALSRWASYIRNFDNKNIKKDGIDGAANKIDVMGPDHPAIQLWLEGGKHDAGNGGVMRCMPTALWEPVFNNRIEQTTRICMDSHPDPRCIGSCVITVELLHEMIERDLTKPEVMSMMHNLSKNLIKNEDLTEELKDVENLKWKDTGNGGYTVDTMVSAMSGFYLSESFEDGLVAVVNKGNDADTVGAVVGSLMGAFYGYKAIPERWLDALANTEQMLDFAEKLYSRKRRVTKELNVQNPA